MDGGLLILRLVVGLYLFGHGAQKSFGWFGGAGPAGTRAMMGRLNFRPEPLWALAVSLAETGGGLLLALGFLSPLGNFAILAAMFVAIVAVHWSKGLWATKSGIELPAINFATALALLFTGPGRISVDELFGLHLPEPTTTLVLAIATALGLAAAFASRRAAAAAAPRPPTPAA